MEMKNQILQKKQITTVSKMNKTSKALLHNLPLKLFLLFMLLVANVGSLSAQNFMRRGFAFGADRDTLYYIIASPFDNWFITLGGGIQTFMGNELVASARENKLNFVLKGEIGKWIIPDVAISLRYSMFNVDGQTQYGRNPFIDKINDIPNANGYYPFHANAMSLMGYVTLDWTNFFRGYENGRRRNLHIFTPIGLGMSVLYGTSRNPRDDKFGKLRTNYELSYAGGIGVEYEILPEISVNANVEIFGSESTWDWSPYDNSYSRFDVMPNFTVGVRFNLLKQVHKRDMYTNTVFVDTVYHYFRSFGGRTTIPTLNARIEVMEREIDSIQNMSDGLIGDDSAQRAALAAAIQTVDSLRKELEADSMRERPINIMQDLSNINRELGLPATVVYFQLDKYDLDINARKRLQRFAKSMNRMSDTLEYFIIGAADSLTGSKRHNDVLSDQRCKAAYNALVKDYGANGNQLTLVPVGGITAYEPKEDNRMAMVILRTPEIEAIIQKWTRYKK